MFCIFIKMNKTILIPCIAYSLSIFSNYKRIHVWDRHKVVRSCEVEEKNLNMVFSSYSDLGLHFD